MLGPETKNKMAIGRKYEKAIVNVDRAKLNGSNEVVTDKNKDGITNHQYRVIP